MYGTPFPPEGDVKGFDFSDQTIRRGFIRKVYSILTVQLLVSLGFIALFICHEGTRRYIENNGFIFVLAFIGFVVSIIAISCCESVRRKSPTNFIMLGIFTLCQSLFLGITTSYYETDVVLIAVGLTALICFSLTIFAFQTKYDFTMMGGMLFVGLIILLVMGILCIFIRSKTMHIIYAGAGALLFSAYLIYDTQLILGGEHKYSISPEEYIFAALSLYLDIIQIFLKVLRLVQAFRGD